MRKIKFLFHMNFINGGFTLIELLISISIITVLVTFATTSYSTTQKKSRDAVRESDLKVIQTGFEQYYSACNYVYPTLPAVGASLNCGTNKIIDKIPGDPEDNTAYTCTGCTAGSTAYSVCAYNSEVVPTPCVKNMQ